ncbi:hypothetical protein ABZ599_18355 [Streptomyces misionensis]|uniref:hypothetical protein n=1 Tax=Streptomyces misionensis TaxID=67331 RepID=UPI0033C53BF6
MELVAHGLSSSEVQGLDIIGQSALINRHCPKGCSDLGIDGIVSSVVKVAGKPPVLGGCRFGGGRRSLHTRYGSPQD